MAARKVVELKEKLAGIGSEFDGWLADSATGKPLRKHRTQLERLTAQLRGMTGDIATRIEDVSIDDDKVMATCRQLQTQMLEVHRVWDYYRSKFSLRYVGWFSGYLATADEFAWSCYEPAQAAAAQDVDELPRGGPLIFLSGDFSPFTYARETPNDVAGVPGVLTGEEFNALVAALPIPLIGVPWYQVAHLPDAVLIAHEVGHDVDRDFALGDTIRAHAEPVLGALDPKMTFAWSNWLKEVWADLYGVLAAGPAFVSAMRDLLVTNPQEVIADARAPMGFDSHPPASLRMHAMTYALAKSGFEGDGDAYLDGWNRAFAANGGAAMADVAKEIVDALLAGGFPQFDDAQIGKVVRFSGEQQETAQVVRGEALADIQPQTADVRCLVAGARLAFDHDPELYGLVTEHRVGSQQRIVDRAVAAMGDKTRIRAAESEITAEADQSAGQALFRRLILANESEKPEGGTTDDSRV